MNERSAPLYFYFIRHGETDWNTEKRVQGREDIPLNGKGRAQAAVLAETLRPVPFSYVFSSPLSRAYETARMIAACHPGAKLLTDPLLLERDFGNISGTTAAEREWFFQNGGHEEVEPVSDVRARVDKALIKMAGFIRQEKAALHSGCSEPSGPVHAAVVTHGGVIYHLLEMIEEGALEAAVGQVFLHNCDVTVIGEDRSILAIDLTTETFPAFWNAFAGRTASEP